LSNWGEEQLKLDNKWACESFTVKRVFYDKILKMNFIFVPNLLNSVFINELHYS
jgi:hypothetical protein